MHEQDAPLPAPPDAWSGFAEVYELPASVEHELAGEAESAPAVKDTDEEDLVHAVVRLTKALEDERALRARAEDARIAAEVEARTGAADAVRLTAELASERARLAQLEHDRDEVIHRAEELLVAVRDRGEQKLAAELEAARRHWTELLAVERRRVDALDSERAALLERVGAVDPAATARQARPLRRPAPPEPEDVVDDEEGSEGESAELTAEMERLRQRLRTRLRKPPEMTAVEDGVEGLRQSRLAREKKGRRG